MLPRLLQRDEDPPRLLRTVDGHLPPPGERDDGAVGVDPQRVRGHHQIARGGPGELDERAGVYAGQLGGEARVIGVQVLEHDALVVADGVDLLVARRRLEELAVEVVVEGDLRPTRLRPAFGAAPELVATEPPRG